MPKQWDEIQRLTLDAMNAQSPVISQMREILKRYEGDWVLPVPSMPDEPVLPPLTPALIAQAVDFNGRRAASVFPTIKCPAIKPTVQQGMRSVEWGMKRKRALSAVYDASKYGLGRRRSMKHLAAYHTYSQRVVPNFKTGMPQILIGDPLGTFTDPRAIENLEAPEYMAFVTRLSGEVLRKRFPMLCGENGGPISKYEVAQLWNMLEWMDYEQIVFGLLGPVLTTGTHIQNTFYSGQTHCQIGPAIPNKAEMCCAIMPVNLSLGGIASGLGQMLGNIDLQAKLMGLDILAQERAIFPDMYVLGREGAQPRLVNGKWQEGRTGNVNLIQDAQAVGLLHMTPDQRTGQTVDRLERNFKTSTNLVPQAAGETYGALRTGRAIDALGGMAVDPGIQEMQEIDAAWMRHTNSAILATYKGYFPDKKFTLFSGWPGDEGHMDFTPSKHVESLENVVSYPVPGADVTQMTQIFGSMLGAGVISVDTFQNQHPWIQDPQAEQEKLRSETLSRALEQGLAQQLASGAMPLPLAEKIYKHLVQGLTMFEAVGKANEELKQEQAAAVPPAPPEMAAAPEAMPGMAAGPAAMMPQGQPAQPPAPPPDQIQSFDQVAQMNKLMAQMVGKR